MQCQTKEEYYFVAELATPLLTLYDTYANGLARMTRDQLYLERDSFCFTLNAILNHPDNSNYNGKSKLLYWDNDPQMSIGMSVLVFLPRVAAMPSLSRES